jgi:hypothetical protein
MLNLSAKSEAPDLTKLSDAELIAQLGEQARELNVSSDLTRYTFAQQRSRTSNCGKEPRGCGRRHCIMSMLK